MRAIWKGNISFGLFYIPVAVYSAIREESLGFRQLRKKDLSSIRYKKVVAADGRRVCSVDMLKGLYLWSFDGYANFGGKLVPKAVMQGIRFN
jgi:non-homologous end joining protein Ku